ncbi:MAG: nuclease-related domain-containing protein [Actinomycetota bacterium]
MFDDAGRSARETGERRRAKQLENYEQLSRLKKILKGRPRDAGQTWESGSIGEVKVGEMLKKLADERVIAQLNDLRVPGTSANIDHVAVAPSGVHVIDAKRYTGRVEVRTRKGERELWVKGRNRMKLIDQLAKQVLTIEREIHDLTGTTVVTPVLCFVDVEWKIRERNCALNGVRITHRKELEKRLREPGPLDDASIFWIAERLATTFRPA